MSLWYVSRLQIMVQRVTSSAMFALLDWSISTAVCNEITKWRKCWQRPSEVTLFYNIANTEYYKETQFSLPERWLCSVVTSHRFSELLGHTVRSVSTFVYETDK
jgi:hypothetical protein